MQSLTENVNDMRTQQLSRDADLAAAEKRFEEIAAQVAKLEGELQKFISSFVFQVEY